MPVPRRLKIVIGVFLVIALTCLVYYSSLKNNFVNWGDGVHVFENVSIRGLDWNHIKLMFLEKVNGAYVPLTTLSFAVEYHFVKFNAYYFHLTNLIIHLANALLIYIVVHRLGVGFVGSAVAGIIFAIHPIQVESVAWVTGRQSVLYSFFYLLSILAYLKYQFALKRSKSGWLFLSWVYGFGVLSMLSSPLALTLPFVLILLDWYEGRTFSIKSFLDKLPLLIVLLCLAFLTFDFTIFLDQGGVLEKFWILIYSVMFYVRKFFAWDFSTVIYQLPKFVSMGDILSFCALSGIAVLMWFYRRNNDLIFAAGFYGISIFIIFWINALSAMSVPNIIADRFMYLPCLGFCLFLAKWVEECWLSKNPKWIILSKIGVALAVGVLSYLGLQSYRQTLVWQNGFSLWDHQLRHYPNDSNALNNLAINFRVLPDFKKAEKEYRKYKNVSGGVITDGVLSKEVIEKVGQVVGLFRASIDSNPKNIESIYNLGSFYYDLGEFDASLKSFEEVLRLDSKYKPAIFGKSDALLAMNQPELALKFISAAVVSSADEDVYLNFALSLKEYLKVYKNEKLQKAFDELLGSLESLAIKNGGREASYFNLGYLYGEIGNIEKAKLYYEKAIAKNPRYTDALYNLGNIFKDTGRLEEALKLYQNVIELEPEHEETYLNIGVVYNRLSKFSEATNYFKKALEVDPADGRPYFNLAYIGELAGNLDDAIRNYRLSVELDPGNAEGYYNLGNVYAKTSQNKEAISSYLKAVEVNPGHLNAWVNLSIIAFQEKDYKNAVKYCDEAVLLGYVPEEGYLEALREYRGK